MSAHRRSPRPYRGGKRRTTSRVSNTLDLSTPTAEKPVPAPGEPGGPGQRAAMDRICDGGGIRVIHEPDLAFDASELRDEKGRWTINPDHIVSRWHGATVGEKKAGRDWYPAAHRTALALSKKYGISKEEAAGLLAAYSPQTPWGRNQILAGEALREGHAIGGPGAAVWFTHNDPTVEDRVGVMATGHTRALADSVLHGTDFDVASAGLNKNGTVKPKALKIRSFYHLISQGGQSDPRHPYVVIDRHAMSVAFGKRVTEDDYDKMHPASRKQYKPFVDAYVEAAKRISAEEGRTVTPEEVQATTWLTQQRLNQSENTRVGKTRKALGSKDWAEWTQYAARYLGIDTEGGAQVGYTSLSNVHEPDLAFNPAEPRDEAGRWLRFETYGRADYTGGVKAYDRGSGEKVGELKWFAGDLKPIIDNIYVSPAHRRKGVATALLAEARKSVPDLQHSKTLTPDGRAFSEKSLSNLGPAIAMPRDLDIDLANPSLGRTRYITSQLLDGKDAATLLHHRGISREVAEAVAALANRGTVHRPNARRSGHPLTTAIRIERDREALYRGAYLLKAAERVQANVDAGRTLKEALNAESVYYNQHEKARRNRLEAVTKAQRNAIRFGQQVDTPSGTRTLIGWYMDPLLNNDPECRAANGHNFYAEEGTVIGFPGAVHLNCGCTSGPPISGARMVNEAVGNVVQLGHVSAKPTYTLSRKKRTA